MGTQDGRPHAAWNIKRIEQERQQFQNLIEQTRKEELRRKLGQFFTPLSLSLEIMEYGLSLLSGSQISFLEPAFGTGSLYSALLQQHDPRPIAATGIEMDDSIYREARKLWHSTGIQIIHNDFTTMDVPERCYNFVVSNPPYVRHQLLEYQQKVDLKQKVKSELSLDISGLSGLYCYFLLLAHKWLETGAVCGWLIPSEFMDVNYGKAIKQYLLNYVRLIRIHRYDISHSQFHGALVSSCVVWFKQEAPKSDDQIQFSYGGTHQNPLQTKLVSRDALQNESKWTRFPSAFAHGGQALPTLGDYFSIRRGIATGDNHFFILTEQQIADNHLSMCDFVPILPSSKNLKTDEIFSDSNGYPILEKPLFLLYVRYPKDELMEKHPALWHYLRTGEDTVAKKYLCRSRKEWYFQEKRNPAPFLCSYMGRSDGHKSPFRFILNDSNAIATNSFLMMYPNERLSAKIAEQPSLKRTLWNVLRSLRTSDLECAGRIYGGGLRKIEPKELSKVHVSNLLASI